jgi:hypothetical protein
MIDSHVLHVNVHAHAIHGEPRTAAWGSPGKQTSISSQQTVNSICTWFLRNTCFGRSGGRGPIADYHGIASVCGKERGDDIGSPNLTAVQHDTAQHSTKRDIASIFVCRTTGLRHSRKPSRSAISTAHSAAQKISGGGLGRHRSSPVKMSRLISG